MFARLGHVLLIIALLGATGGHWAVLQTIAWTNMLANNLQTESVAVAINKTFNGKNPCCLCKQISAGKQQEKKSELPLQIKKMEFVCEHARLTLCAPIDFVTAANFIPELEGLSHRPSVPPPRLRAA